MTAAVLHVVETVDCLTCNGSGFVWIYNGPDPEDIAEQDCPSCNGELTVPADQVSVCDSCQGKFWTSEGCDHEETLCETCGAGCRDCAAERYAELEADHLRDQAAMSGGGWS